MEVDANGATGQRVGTVRPEVLKINAHGDSQITTQGRHPLGMVRREGGRGGQAQEKPLGGAMALVSNKELAGKEDGVVAGRQAGDAGKMHQQAAAATQAAIGSAQNAEEDQ